MADCFVHASDLHLDAPLGNLGMLDKERQRDLAKRAAGAWQCLVQLCIDEEASFLVLAGDIFHEAAAGVGVQQLFQDGLRELDGSGVSVFICHGNHDPLGKDFRPIGELPQNAVRFEPGKPQWHPVTLRHSRDRVQVSGVSFGVQHERENLASRFREIERPQDAAAHIAVLHANVGSSSGHGEYAPCTWDDLDTESVDYWALGHIHKRGIRRLPNGAWAAYCGNLQGRNFKPSECEPKGALVVPIEDGRIGEPAFMPCDRVRFERSDLEVTPGDSVECVSSKIRNVARELGDKHAPQPVAWKCRLIGSNAEATRLHEPGFRRGLLDGSADELSGRLNGGGLCDVRISLREPVDRERIVEAGDLRVEVLNALDRLRDTAESSDAANPELGDLLLGLLPDDVKWAWRQALEEDREIMSDVVDLTEQLLLAALDERSADAK
ncbi:metallophosphoesterase family protein [Candidatus Poriferisodalis sp.]|uniref:metallophosphoesterase family protein n=1 Tax=Candidatus Poriferisodalis sp. TaxID=3101277 RepID=UPI003B013DFA